MSRALPSGNTRGAQARLSAEAGSAAKQSRSSIISDPRQPKKPRGPTPALPPSANAPPVPPPASAAAWTSPIVDAGGSNRTGSFSAIIDPVVPPHTLILGTQPSNVSLANGWYFGRDTNAFWPLVGCGLGFRRGFHEGARQIERGDVVQSISAHLPPKETSVVVGEYAEAVRRLTGAGYALWDILESSERVNKATGKRSSLDAHIKKERPARIRELVEAHPTVRKIVFATGKGSAEIFRRHFGAWLAEGGFCCGNDEAADVFGASPCRVLRKGDGNGTPAIELVVPISVSPAAANFTFGEKRDNWLCHVFNAE
jgi:G:T/U-mismatch repair DNA glycosylase